MKLHLQKSNIKQSSKIAITGSKSEANRILILQALYSNIQIDNLSNSDDSQLMQKALASKEEIIDIHHAGTAMRFLTAYFSVQEGRQTTLTGSKRMKERPIGILVDALNVLGADISYAENKGFPPIIIKGKKLTNYEVTLKANVSSQYISALLLIASGLKNGLKLTLEGKITSVPYIKMTLSLLDQIGVENSFENNSITVKPKQDDIEPQVLVVESDWSSASYFYSIAALSKVGTQVQLSSYKKDSLQGDSVLAEIYKQFGVETIYLDNKIILEKSSVVNEKTSIELDLSNAPDIAQTICVTAFGLRLKCNLRGLHTLKIKETDRLLALQNELTKLGASISVTNDALSLEASDVINPGVEIETYNDHRMAMAFAPLALRTSILIKDANVVSKSYPDFWKDLAHIGFSIK
ncbi:3-phosphoshikimate 1-carboxyvinyltransferase [Winogradskyella sp. PC-19]|uniref:3-phosphoshikimate 1-carboxyvinyltransferase n=1 Tax=unclassified Winogradskyella TaxID=2615021 RepID=UPI000B3D3227|nr:MULTISPECIES: 3-phosphoshikimate 1-carboxyvinyltransferase [unclassified Winogradskyella]ARV09335.1 3-phosphoshikimate 1-carboxyvinyltransferase [Winogradskyella sp. PC-19]RZN83149.1 MAG: 3-phosphoshikimate 1-carboxyvinyltransferase [Winogradskyella sp.]